MKHNYPFRRHICLCLALLLAAALCGCAKAPAGSPAAKETAAPDPAPTEAAAPAPTAEPEPAQPEPTQPRAMTPGFFLTAEYDRLYYAPLDGSTPRLLVDSDTTFTVRCGKWLYASFEDGSVRRVLLDGSEIEELLPAGGHVYQKLFPWDGGFIGVYYSMIDGPGYDLVRSGAQTPTPLFNGDRTVEPCAVGKYLYCDLHRYDPSAIAAYDLDSLEKRWELEVDDMPDFVRDEDGLLCFVPNRGKLFRLDEEAGALIPLELPLAKTDCELAAVSNGVYIVKGNYSDDFRRYLVDRNGRRQMDDSLPEYFRVKDLTDGKALLYYVESEKSAASEDVWVTLDRYKVLDMASGEIRDFPVRGEYGALFADGDFPTVDSSTARKPVTAEIYAFFCESTGAGGKTPLCSTTHGAWLNIADRGADLALLASPTQEERDYLDERGVSVEMKLYGGDGLVFIGNQACGVEDLSLEQLRAIYRGEITNWAQLGGVNHAINVLYRDDQSGSQRLFERMLWQDESVPDFEALGFERLDEMSTIVSQCLYDPYAIGYSIMTYLRDVYGKEELLAFSLEGYAATPENVAAQRYPLGTQGYVVIRSDEPENSPARRLYNWFGSPLSDLILTRNGVTPLHG